MVSSGIRDKTITVRLKDSCPAESGHIVTQENVHFASGNYETKSSKLADKNAKCGVVFEMNSTCEFDLGAKRPVTPTAHLPSDKTRCFSQSERYMETSL